MKSLNTNKECLYSVFTFLMLYFRCTIDLSLLSKEHTHKLDLPLEEGYGVLVLLVTLTASAAVSISDMSVNILDDPNERHQITQRYVSSGRKHVEIDCY